MATDHEKPDIMSDEALEQFAEVSVDLHPTTPSRES